MAKVYSNAGKIAACDGWCDIFDGGSGDASGDFVLMTSADAILATLPFSSTAFAASAVVGGAVKASANAITNSATPTAGAIAKGAWRDRSNAAHFTFGIAVSGSDMDIADVNIPGGTTAVTCSGLVVTFTMS